MDLYWIQNCDNQNLRDKSYLIEQQKIQSMIHLVNIGKIENKWYTKNDISYLLKETGTFSSWRRRLNYSLVVPGSTTSIRAAVLIRLSRMTRLSNGEDRRVDILKEQIWFLLLTLHHKVYLMESESKVYLMESESRRKWTRHLEVDCMTKKIADFLPSYVQKIRIIIRIRKGNK